MELLINANGQIRCLYDEAIDLRNLGAMEITRGSQVEPGEDGFWWADLSPVKGPMLGPYPNRSEALDAERTWLLGNWLHNRSS